MRQRIHIIGFIGIILLFFSANVEAYSPNLSSPLGKNEHPRLLVNPASLSVIAARATGSHAAMYSSLKSKADELLVEDPKMGGYSITIFNRTAILALVAMIEKSNGSSNTQYRDRAFFYAQYVLDSIDPWTLTSHYSGSSYGMRGRTGALSLVYDWLYADLPATLKTDIHDFLVNVYKGLNNIDRPSGIGQRRKSAYGSNYWLQQGAYPWFSVALYGDGEGDEGSINDALDAAKNEVDTFMVPALTMLGGALHNGWGYQLADGDTSFSFINLLAWQSAVGDSIYSNSFALKDYTQYFLHASRPDGTLSKINDTNDKYTNPLYPYGTGKWGRAYARSVLILLMDIYDDGYAKYIVDKQDFSSSGNGGDHGWMNLIFYDDSVVERAPSTLPLVRFFPQTGILFGRSGWDANDLYYTFRNRDQYGNHTDAKQNSFTIFSKGSPLAINDGNYPSGASGASSTNDYYRRTLSSNSMLIYDPVETWLRFGPMLSDGGQKYAFYDATTGTAGYQSNFNSEDYNQVAFDASENNSADNVFEDGASYTYIQGDATRAYTNKVTHYTREFVHIKQDYFVILDRVGSSQQSFRKKWLLHSIGEPLLNGSEDFSCVALPGESACQGTTSAGISKSTNSDEAVVTNGSGRLFVKTLLPASSVIRKLGGSGYKFWQDAANADIPPKSYTESVTGGWRLEISPQTANSDSDGDSTDLFLHVLYPTDSSVTSMPNSTLISNANGNMASNNMVGVHIKDNSENKIVLFASDEKGAIVSGAINYALVLSATDSSHYLYNLPASQKYNVNVSSNGAVISITPTAVGTQVSSENGVLVFTYKNGVLDTTAPDVVTGIGFAE